MINNAAVTNNSIVIMLFTSTMDNTQINCSKFLKKILRARQASWKEKWRNMRIEVAHCFLIKFTYRRLDFSLYFLILWISLWENTLINVGVKKALWYMISFSLHKRRASNVGNTFISVENFNSTWKIYNFIKIFNIVSLEYQILPR